MNQKIKSFLRYALSYGSVLFVLPYLVMSLGLASLQIQDIKISLVVFISIFLFIFLVPSAAAGFLLAAIYALTGRLRSIKGFLKLATGIAGVSSFLLYIALPVLIVLFQPEPPPPEKITAENFSFLHYQDASPELETALKKILPVGTPKTSVEQVLVAGTGAHANIDTTYAVKSHPEITHVVYEHLAYPGLSPFCLTPKIFVDIKYENDKLAELTVLHRNGCEGNYP